MGLVMFLIGEKFWPEANITEDGFRLVSHNLAIGHWHDLWALDEYIQGYYGVEEERFVNLDGNHLQAIIRSLNGCGDNLEFLEEYDDSTIQDLIETFTNALEWLTTDEELRLVTYSSRGCKID